VKRIDFDPIAIRARILADARALIVIAGPNGAGKSTFVDEVLRPLGLRFVNADLLAKAFWPDAPADFAYEAAELAETLRQDLLSRGVSFCMETVFSDPGGAKLEFLRKAQSKSYQVFLFFIGVESSALSITRVATRTSDGGHDVPDQKIIERFPRTLRNLSSSPRSRSRLTSVPSPAASSGSMRTSVSKVAAAVAAVTLKRGKRLES
jgi:predicted ABC-type ATPase